MTTPSKAKKKLSLASIKAGALVGSPVPATIEIMVNGEESEIETFISPANYQTAIASYQAYAENKEAMAGIIASRIVDEKGAPEFTEAEVRQFFNDSLTIAVWSKIYEVDHPDVGKDSATTTTSCGTSLSSTESEAEPLPKPGETLALPSSSSGENTESAGEASTLADELSKQSGN